MNDGLIINYAYRTFVWDSEASVKAHVHCVIIGFSTRKDGKKVLFHEKETQGTVVSNINSYLIDAPTFFVESHSSPLCDVPPMRFGSMPRDGGGFVLTDEERDEFIKDNPICEKWIHPYIGASEFINRKSRWCLWLLGANPTEIIKCPKVMERVNYVRDFRLNSVAAGTRKFAETPTLFCQIAQPDTDYLMVPKVSSERRKYVPIDFMSKDVIASDLVFLVPNATVYTFGVMTSLAHNAWMRVVCGRLKSDYRYAKDIVYNNFPWPKPTAEQKEQIERTAQGILDARALYPDASFADMYGNLLLFPELNKAHRANDAAVLEAYGFPKDATESDIVARLFKMYQELTSK